MANQQLLDYVKEQRAAGAKKEDIVGALSGQGWKAHEIEEAFALAAGGVVSVPTALPGGGALLGEAWRLFLSKSTLLLGISTVPALLSLVASMGSGYLQTYQQTAALSFPSPVSFFYIAGFVTGLLAVVIISLWTQVALLYAVKDAGENIGFAEAFKRGGRKIWAYLWVTFLVGFITMGGLFLAVIPGILFTGWFCLSVFILIAEDERGMRALLKSRAYVQGQWWAVLWRLLFVSLIAFVVGFAAGFVGSFLPYGELVANFAFSLFLTPVTLCYLYRLYSHVRASRAGLVFAPTGGQKATFIAIGAAGLLIIPLVLLTLSSVVFTGLSSARMKAQSARNTADIRMLQVSLELYKDANGNYPASLEELVPEYTSTLPDEYTYSSDGVTTYELCPGSPPVLDQCVSSQ